MRIVREEEMKTWNTAGTASPSSDRRPDPNRKKVTIDADTIRDVSLIEDRTALRIDCDVAITTIGGDVCCVVLYVVQKQ